MLGVVIWTDSTENKAIIWCEDHGGLAFLGDHPHDSLDANAFAQGDLIQFDLAQYRNLRLARNARKIAQHYCSDLSKVIATAQSIQEEFNAVAQEKDACAVLPIAKRERASKQLEPSLNS